MGSEDPQDLSKPSSAIERLARRYAATPLVRALVQLIPFGVGSAVDVAIATAVTNIREDRAREFFDELARSNLALSEEQMAQEDFLHAYFATAKAALNTRRREKIRLFSRLLANYLSGKSFETTDAYEETLGVLDDMSLREFQVLLILDRFEKAHPRRTDENPLQGATRFWGSFLDAVEAEASLRREDIPSFLERLNRTGLYQTFVGGFWDYTGDKGHLTPKFDTLVRALSEAGASHVSAGQAGQCGGIPPGATGVTGPS